MGWGMCCACLCPFPYLQLPGPRALLPLLRLEGVVEEGALHQIVEEARAEGEPPPLPFSIGGLADEDRIVQGLVHPLERLAGVCLAH